MRRWQPFVIDQGGNCFAFLCTWQALATWEALEIHDFRDQFVNLSGDGSLILMRGVEVRRANVASCIRRRM